MHWTRVSLFCLGAALLASTQSALAQVVSEQTGVVQLEDYSGSMSLANDGGSWMQVDRMSGDGVGFQSGFTRVGIRNKWIDFGNSHVFTELNGTMNDHGRLGTNLGLGYRTMYDSGVLGIHGWYDNYESNYGHNYQQAVLGAEYLHEFMDLRANGYMPFGDRDNFIGVIDPGDELTFQGHDFGTLGRAQIERSLGGFDAEAGVPLPVATFLKMFAGTYYLRDNKDDDTWGVRSRLEARVGQGATLNFMVTDDNTFGTNLNFGATIWYGGGPTSPFKFPRDRSGWSRIYDPVRRNQPVQLAQDRKQEVFVPLVNTDTGNRFNITWVDNTAGGPGNGTVENPFVQLPNTAPGSDYILVRRGAGDTLGNIVLENNQHLFGEGQVYKVRTDRLGEVDIPDAFFDQTGTRPTLRPTAPNVPTVTLANNNEVINFNMQGGTAAGIFGNFVRDFRIENVEIRNSVGIFLDDASGNGLLNNIDVTNVAAGQTGITIRNQNADRLNLTMNDITTSGGNTGVLIDALGAQIVGSINNLEINNTADTGLVLFQDNSLMNLRLQDVEVNSNNDGILIDSFDGQSNIDLVDVSVTGAGDLINILGGGGTILTVDGLNVDASSSGAGSGVTINVNNTTGLFRFENLTASNNNDDGFRLNATNGSIVKATIVDSVLNANKDNNFDVTASGGSVVQFFVDPTSATDSKAEAFQFVASGPGTVLTSIFADVDLARAGESAISGLVTGGALSYLYLDNVQASDSGLHGLNVNVVNGSASDSSDFAAYITNSTFTRSGKLAGGRGVNLLASNNSNIYIEMDGTPANNNGSEGLHYEALTGANGGSSITGIVTNGNFSDNPDYNVFGLVNGVDSTANWTFTNVTADLLSSSGSVVLASVAGGRQDIEWSGAGSSISQSAGDGVNLEADGAGSIINFEFRDGRINSNGGQGIDAIAVNGGSVQVDLEDAEVTLSTQENILAAAQTNSRAIVNATNTNVSLGGRTTSRDNVLLTATGVNSEVGGIFDGVNLDGSGVVGEGLHGLHANISAGGDLNLEFRSSDPLNPSSASNNASGSGIRIEGSNADRMTVVSSGNSVISDNFADNVDIDILTANFASIQIAGQMDGSQNGDGINILFDDVDSGGIDIGPGSANDNFNDGVDIRVVNNSTLGDGISISNMTVTGNGGEPIKVATSNSTIVGGSIDGNNTDGGTTGISWTSDSGTVDVNISNNNVTNATSNGILVDLLGTAVGNDVSIDFNNVSGDGVAPLNGVRLNVRDAAQLTTATINGNVATNAANYGVFVEVTGTGAVNSLTADANTLSGSGIDGMLYSGAAGTTLNSLVISDNASDQNGANGLNVQLDGVAGDATVEFRGNLVNSNAINGILMTATDTSLTSVDFLGNNASTNGGDGIQIDLSSPGGASTLGAVNGLNNTVVGNLGAGINVMLDGFTTAPDVALEGNTANNNGAEGVALTITDMNAGQLTVSDSTFDDNGADGLRVSLTNNATDTLSILRNTANNNVLNGFNYDADNAALGNLVIADNQGAVIPGASVLADVNGVHWQIANTTADPLVLIDSVTYDVGPTGLTYATTRGAGFPFSLYVSGSQTGLQTVNGNAINTAAVQQPGVLADGATVMDLVFTDFDNGDPTLHFDVTIADASGSPLMTTADIAGTIFTANMSNGAVLSGSFDATGILSLTQAATGTGVAGNGLAGILIGLDNGSSIGTMSIDSNDVIGNGTNGIQFNVANASTLPTAGNAAISNNNISGHENGDGVNIVNPDTGGADFGIDFDSNTMTDNFGSGVNLALNGDSGVVTTTFTNNDISGNGSSGISANLIETADLQITNFEGNTVNGNTQMGVRIQTADTANILLNGSAGNNSFDANSDAGIGAVIRNNSTADIRMSNSTITNTTAGALPEFAGQGVRIIVENGDGVSEQLLGTSEFNGNTITGNAGNGVDILVRDFGVVGGLTINDNTINNSGTNAVRIERQESGRIGTALDRLEVSGNIITGQNEGVLIIAANTDSTDFYEMNDNQITGMTGSGVHFIVQADADINVNMDNNLLSGNALDGILTTEQINSAADSRSVSGVWTNNEITNNGRHGVNLSASSGLVEIGTAGNGNTITGNANDGISVNGAGAVLIVGNLISQNGSNGADDAGIDIQSPTFSFVGISGNDIVNNRGDGIEFTGGIGPFGDTLIVDGNNISFNQGRGFDVLQMGNTTETNTDITFDNNTVSNNRLEGIYVVFTADRTQSQSADATVALASNGSIDNQSQMRFNMDNNSVTANGTGSNFSTTGMVVRIGTMEASTNINDDGGFISDGLGNFTNKSGVIMNVTNSNFSGNFGDDVYFESFVSTANPPNTAGTWGATNDPTAITTFRGDPLARLDLTFTGNTGDSADVTNAGAFYNNQEDTFKSRTNTQSPPFQGPFTSGVRRRNAQRLASRTAPYDDPAGGANFLYPGVGESTFRISAGSSTAGFASNPFPSSFGTAVGFGGAITGELPFVWGSF